MNEPPSPDDPTIILPTLEPSPVPKRLEQVNTPIPDREKIRSSRRKTAGCAIVVLAMLLCLISVLCGGFGYAYFQELGWLPRTLQKDDSSAAVLNVQKEKICGMVGIEEKRNFEGIAVSRWQGNTVAGGGENMEPGKVIVNGWYMAKYGIDYQSIKIWEYYPMTSELQISIPRIKLTGLHVLPAQFLDGESLVMEDLPREETDFFVDEVKKQLLDKARVAIEADPTIRSRCVQRLKALLAAFGINLVLVEEAPGVS